MVVRASAVQRAAGGAFFVHWVSVLSGSGVSFGVSGGGVSGGGVSVSGSMRLVVLFGFVMDAVLGYV